MYSKSFFLVLISWTLQGVLGQRSLDNFISLDQASMDKLFEKSTFFCDSIANFDQPKGYILSVELNRCNQHASLSFDVPKPDGLKCPKVSEGSKEMSTDGDCTYCPDVTKKSYCEDIRYISCQQSFKKDETANKPNLKQVLSYEMYTGLAAKCKSMKNLFSNLQARAPDTQVLKMSLLRPDQRPLVTESKEPKEATQNLTEKPVPVTPPVTYRPENTTTQNLTEKPVSVPPAVICQPENATTPSSTAKPEPVTPAGMSPSCHLDCKGKYSLDVLLVSIFIPLAFGVVIGAVGFWYANKKKHYEVRE